MEHFRALFFAGIFVFGLCVGSFLNCVIYRLEQGKGFIRGKSFCPKCKHKLGFWDLIPVLSFIALGSKCRYCKKKISWQYPMVEIATGGLFLLIFNFQFSHLHLAGFGGQAIFRQFSILQFSNLIYLWIVACFLEVIFIYDLKHYIILDKVIYPAVAMVFLYRLFGILNFGHWELFGNWKLEIGNSETLKTTLIAAFAAAAFFFLIWLASRGKWMGFGDVKLGFLLGLFLGFPKILVALFLAFLVGALVGLALMALGKKKLKSEVPFGPFLITGTFIALFWGREIINWYLGFL